MDRIKQQQGGYGAGSGQGVGTLMAMGDTFKPKKAGVARLSRQGAVLPAMAAFGTLVKPTGAMA